MNLREVIAKLRAQGYWNDAGDVFRALEDMAAIQEADSRAPLTDEQIEQLAKQAAIHNGDNWPQMVVRMNTFVRLVREADSTAESAPPVGVVRHYQYAGLVRNGGSVEAVLYGGIDLPEGAKLYAAPPDSTAESAQPVAYRAYNRAQSCYEYGKEAVDAQNDFTLPSEPLYAAPPMAESAQPVAWVLSDTGDMTTSKERAECWAENEQEVILLYAAPPDTAAALEEAKRETEKYVHLYIGLCDAMGYKEGDTLTSPEEFAATLAQANERITELEHDIDTHMTISCEALADNGELEVRLAQANEKLTAAEKDAARWNALLEIQDSDDKEHLTIAWYNARADFRYDSLRGRDPAAIIDAAIASQSSAEGA